MSDHDARPGIADGAAVTMGQLLTIPRRRWRWLVAFAALGVAAVAGYLTFLPASHTATAAVTVRPVVTDPFSYPGPGADRAVNMNVENGIATGDQVAATVAKATGRSVTEVRDALGVAAPVGGQVLRFAYTTTDAGEAVTGANAAANAYLRVRRDDYRAQRDSQLDSYDASLAALTKKESAAERRDSDEQSNNGGAAGTRPTSDRVRALNDQISSLTEQRARIAAIDLTPGTLTTPAARPVPSSHDDAALYLFAGLIGGLLLGAIAGYARESTDRRVRRAADAIAAVDAPLLGVLRRSGPVATRAYRADVDYVAIAVARLAAEGRSVMLLSSRADEGRADVAADLAIALALLGEDVYLGDVLGTGDQLNARVLGNPAARPRPVLVVDDDADVTLALDVEDQVADTVQFPAVTLAAVGTNGRSRPEVSDQQSHATSAVRGPTTRRSVVLDPDTLRRQPIPVVEVGTGTVSVGPAATAPADALVLLDAPPIELDARGIRMLDGAAPVLLAVRDRTRLTELRRAARRLRNAGTAPAGVVLIGGQRG